MSTAAKGPWRGGGSDNAGSGRTAATTALKLKVVQVPGGCRAGVAM